MGRSERLDLYGANLAEGYFLGSDFTGSILEKANFENAALDGAVLNKCNLVLSIMNGAHIHHAKIRNANLTYAMLMRANLVETDLTGSMLSGANLDGVNFKGSNLSYVNLESTDIRNALFYNTQLDGTNFENSTLRDTIFCSLDLSKAKKLNTLKHEWPSSIDILTLEKSKGLIPIEFLRGCGAPDEFIELSASFKKHYPNCLICYSSREHKFAEKLHSDLQDKGVRCYFAPENMKIGENILDALYESIRETDKIILILSKNSIHSSWVKDEISKAFEEERRRNTSIIIPISIDDAAMKTEEAWTDKIRARKIGDFQNYNINDSYKKSLKRLLRDLKKKDTI
jgi:TIR domain-containing protein/pentapeptide repeat protein